MTTGILAFGAYLPRKRLQRSAIRDANSWFVNLDSLAIGERSIADWDEDSITMAVEAGRDALSGRDRSDVACVALASTTLPFLDRQNSGVVKEALNLSDNTGTIDVTGSQRAATSMLIQALQGASERPGTQLCLAADIRKSLPASEGELTNGDAAAAMLVGRGNPIANWLGSFSTSIDFVDHFRAEGMAQDYTWEGRWIRDEGLVRIVGAGVDAALKKLGINPSRVDQLIVPITQRGVADGLAKQLGIRPEAVVDTLGAAVGNSGAAHPFLLLAYALEAASPGEKIVLVGFGQGVDVVAFETTAALANRAAIRGVTSNLKRGVKDHNYLRWLFHCGAIELDRGMRAEIDQKQPGTTLWRNRKAVLGLVGGRCTKTGTVQFPKSDISVGLNDQAYHTQEDYPLAERRATVVSYTSDALAYSPSPPTLYGMIDFEGGGRMMIEFADAEPAQIEVGRTVEMRFRIKATDEVRGFTKYFWKAAPVAEGA